MKDRQIIIGFFILMLLVLGLGVVYPNLSILKASFQKDNLWTLSNYQEILGSRLILQATWNSIWISVITAIGSAFVGGGMALIFHFFEFPGRKWFAALAPIPMLMPPLIGVIAFIFLYGESGIMARAIAKLFALKSSPWTLSGPGAILAVHIYSMYAYFYTFVAAGLQKIDYSLIESAQTLGASKFRILHKIILPLLKPALVGAGLLTFMNSMASFSAPYLFGGGTPMLTLQIFNSKVNDQWGLAMAESVLLAGFSLSALLFLQRQRQREYGGSKGASAPRREVTGFLKVVASILGLITMVLILLPPATLILMSFTKDNTWTIEILPPIYTIENYGKVFANINFIEPIRNSLIMSGLASIANLIFALPTAYLLNQKRFRSSKLFDLLVMVPWALPGTVLGLSFAASFNRSHWFTGGFVLIGSFWILPIIYFLRNLPLVVRSTQASIEQLDENLEQAGRSLGGSFFYTLRRVVIPLIWPGAISGTALAFATAMGEFVASILVYVPASRPISIEIAAQLRYQRIGSAAVYGVLLLIIIAISLIFSWRMAGLDNRTINST